MAQPETGKEDNDKEQTRDGDLGKGHTRVSSWIFLPQNLQ